MMLHSQQKFETMSIRIGTTPRSAEKVTGGVRNEATPLGTVYPAG